MKSFTEEQQSALKKNLGPSDKLELLKRPLEDTRLWFFNTSLFSAAVTMFSVQVLNVKYHNIHAFGTVKDRQPMGSTPFFFDRILYQPRFFERKTYFCIFVKTHPVSGHKI